MQHTKTPVRVAGNDIEDADGELLFIGGIGSLYTATQDAERLEAVACFLNTIEASEESQEGDGTVAG